MVHAPAIAGELDLKPLGSRQLLRTYVSVLEELRKRGILRSTNGPPGDYAEYLFCGTFRWKPERNSMAGYDATDSQGTRYQIKGRRLTLQNRSRELSAIRRLDSKPFDYLAAALFSQDFSLQRAALVPIKAVSAESTYSRHTNAWRFHLRDAIWDLVGVRDVTAELKAFENDL